jgi:hypothetical protein
MLSTLSPDPNSSAEMVIASGPKKTRQKVAIASASHALVFTNSSPLARTFLFIDHCFEPVLAKPLLKRLAAVGYRLLEPVELAAYPVSGKALFDAQKVQHTFAVNLIEF